MGSWYQSHTQPLSKGIVIPDANISLYDAKSHRIIHRRQALWAKPQTKWHYATTKGWNRLWAVISVHLPLRAVHGIAVEAVVHTLEDNELWTTPKTFEMFNRTNIMDAWRIWWSSSRRCGKSEDKFRRHFNDINYVHFNFTANCKKNKRVWRVMEYIASKLDVLKEKRNYDWSTTDPVNPRTLMLVAHIVPTAPLKAGGRKRQAIPSKTQLAWFEKTCRCCRWVLQSESPELGSRRHITLIWAYGWVLVHNHYL